MAQAVQDFQYQQELPVYVPQRMGFSKYKTPPGVKPAWGQNVESMLTALELQHYKLAMIRRGYYVPPVADPYEAAAALGADRLPEPSDNVDPNLYTQSISRGVVGADQLVTGGELNDLAEARMDELEAISTQNANKRDAAIAQAVALQAARLSYIYDSEE